MPYDAEPARHNAGCGDDCRRVEHKATSNDSGTWSPYADALARYQGGGYSGIGYELSDEDQIVGIELDK